MKKIAFLILLIVCTGSYSDIPKLNIYIPKEFIGKIKLIEEYIYEDKILIQINEFTSDGFLERYVKNMTGNPNKYTVKFEDETSSFSYTKINSILETTFIGIGMNNKPENSQYILASPTQLEEYITQSFSRIAKMYNREIGPDRKTIVNYYMNSDASLFLVEAIFETKRLMNLFTTHMPSDNLIFPKGFIFKAHLQNRTFDQYEKSVHGSSEIEFKKIENQYLLHITKWVNSPMDVLHTMIKISFEDYIKYMSIRMKY